MRGHDQTHHEVDPSIDGLLGTLTSNRRRCVLYCLLDAEDGQASVDGLIEYLLEYCPEATERERVGIHLYHAELPRLSAAGLVEFDRQSDTVRIDREALCEELIACVRAHEA